MSSRSKIKAQRDYIGPVCLLAIFVWLELTCPFLPLISPFSLISQQVDVTDEPEIRRIRITLTSKNVKAVEKVCTDLKNKALSKSHLVRAGDKEYQSVRVHGPVRMPTKKLRLMVRKSPCGEGTNTYDRFEMRIHKRVLELFCAKEVVSQIANIAMEPGVTVDVMDKPFYENIKTVTHKRKQGA